MDLPRVILESLDYERQGVHHLPQSPSGRQFVAAVDAEKVPEISTLNRLPAELVDDQIVIHAGRPSVDLRSPKRLQHRGWREDLQQAHDLTPDKKFKGILAKKLTRTSGDSSASPAIVS
jgi:hypothetical protein